MASNTLQAVNFPIQLSFDNGVSWKNLVCLTTYSLPLTSANTETQTFCGVEVGLGIVSTKPTGTAICRTYDALANTEVTYGELAILLTSQTLFQFRVMAPTSGSAGRDIFVSASVYCTDCAINFTAGSLVEFTWTFSSTGTVSVTPTP